MKIQREINGQVMEFELTPEELSGAYYEQEHIFDVQNVRDKLEGEMEPGEAEEEYGVPADAILNNESVLDDMGWEARHLQDKYGMSWDAARDKAIYNVVDRRREELSHYQNGVLTACEPYPGLPESCFNVLETTGELIIIQRGESGYHKCSWSVDDPEKNREMADWHNSASGITKAQVAAMVAGSMFGWGVPAADPERYDKNGALKKGGSEARPLDEQIAKCAAVAADRGSGAPVASKEVDR